MLCLSYIKDEIMQERIFYERESMINNWSVRELRSQYDSSLYERISLSKDKKGVLEDSLKRYHEPSNPKDIIKDPYILEFLELEESIISKMREFVEVFVRGVAA